MFRSHTANLSDSTQMATTYKFPFCWGGVSVTVLYTKNFTFNFETHCQLTDIKIIAFFFFTSETSQSWQMLMQNLWHQHDLASTQCLHLHNYSQAFLNTSSLTACFVLGLLFFCAIFPTFLFLNTKPACGRHNFSDVVLESFLELIIYAPWEGLQDWPTPEAGVGEFQQRYQQRSTATWLAWRAAGEAAQGVRSQQLYSAQATLTVPTVPIKAELSITKQDQPAF